MPFPRKKQLALAVLCALPLLAGADDGLTLKPQSRLLPLPETPEDVPLFVEADRIQGTQDKELEAFGNVRLRKRGQAFAADWMRHDTQNEILDAKGNVSLEQGREMIEGSVLRYETVTDRGFMESPRYMLMTLPSTGPAGSGPLPVSDGRGTAERLLFQGPGQYRIESANYTTCEPGNNAWYLRAKELDLDRSRDVGVARDASIVFMDQTIFWSPYLSFSLHEERKSGVLTPSYRSSNTTGFEFTVPYYLNLAPDMDATIYPRYMTKRGLQLGGEFRYLDPKWKGDARAEFLSGDQQIGRDRWAFFSKHQQQFDESWNGLLNLNRVSDSKYFTDLSTQVAVTSQVNLSNDVTLRRGGSWGDSGTYGVSAYTQRFQTLQSDPLAPLTPPYNRQPQLTLTAQRQTANRGDFDFLGNYTAFEILRAQQMELQQASFAKQQDKIAHLQKFINRFKAQASKAKQAQSRVKALERMEKVAPLLAEAEFTDQIRNPRFSFGETAHDRQPGAIRETVEQCHCRIQTGPAAGCSEASRLVIHRHKTMIAM